MNLNLMDFTRVDFKFPDDLEEMTVEDAEPLLTAILPELRKAVMEAYPNVYHFDILGFISSTKSLTNGEYSNQEKEISQFYIDVRYSSGFPASQMLPLVWRK